MEKSTEKSVSSAASGNSINSKLRYPLRSSSLRSKEGKPPVPDPSSSSVPRRGRMASAVSQSTTALDLSSAKKSVDRSKPPPPRRQSIPSKPTSNSSVKSVRSSVTSLSESKAKRSGPSNTTAKRLNETPVSSVVGARKRVEDLSSSTYWLSHIKLAESVAKHSVSLGFFKLALLAGCEPLDQMKDELKSYVGRNNMDGLADAIKELSELYNISEETKQMQISETSSVVAEVSLSNDNDVQSSFATPGNSDITSEIKKEEPLQDSAVTEAVKEVQQVLETIPQVETITSLDEINVNQVTDTAKEEEQVSETIPLEETRRSLDEINVNQEDGASEVVQESENGVIVAQPSDKKRANKKETVAKNNQRVTKKRSLATRTVADNKNDKSQKKSKGVITKSRTKKIQEETKKSTKKPAAEEGEVKPLKQMKKMENKENSVVGAEEDIQV